MTWPFKKQSSTSPPNWYQNKFEIYKWEELDISLSNAIVASIENLKLLFSILCECNGFHWLTNL